MWKRGMVSNKRNVRNPMGEFEKTPLREKKWNWECLTELAHIEKAQRACAELNFLSRFFRLLRLLKLRVWHH